MTGAVIDTDPALPWAAAVADTHLRPTMITTTVAGHLVATALVAMTIADAHLPASSTTGVMEVMDVRRLVVACLMSMAHRAHDTLTILTIPSPRGARPRSPGGRPPYDAAAADYPPRGRY